VMDVLAPFSNVTVLYGHIHREHEEHNGNALHLAARSLAFGFPDITAAEKKPMPFDKEHPFKNLGIRELVKNKEQALKVNEIELTMGEYSGINGKQQLLRAVTY
jgi:hypothetical protein